jgi:23S rRNA (uridine2552-2'-O)-methyltransferase
VEPIEGVEVVRGRVGDPRLAERLAGRVFEVVLSDMSPSISGAYATDHARSVDLVRAAFGLGRGVLAPGGSFVAKVFAGDLLPELESELRAHFQGWRRSKPPSSRGASSEMYLLGLGFRPERSRTATT